MATCRLKFNTVLIIISIVFFMLNQKALGLVCFNCDSTNYPDLCLDEFNTTHALSKWLTKDCDYLSSIPGPLPHLPSSVEDQEKLICVKVKIPIKSAESDLDYYFARGCSIDTPGFDICERFKAFYSDLTDCTTCDSDMCNKSGRILNHWSLLITMLVFLYRLSL